MVCYVCGKKMLNSTLSAVSYRNSKLKTQNYKYMDLLP